MAEQPVQEWYCCSLCDKVGDYWELPDDTTTFDRGHFLGHHDYITTGFSSKEEAQDYLDKNLEIEVKE
jgi:hypothetical protein